jgi:hypothetical protein
MVNVWMLVPPVLDGVVIIFAFLDLGKNSSFPSDTKQQAVRRKRK